MGSESLSDGDSSAVGSFATFALADAVLDSVFPLPVGFGSIGTGVIPSSSDSSTIFLLFLAGSNGEDFDSEC